MSTEKQYEFMLTSRPADGAGLITLMNRPKALNALSTPLFTELNDSVKAFNDDDSVQAVVLPGSERAFAGECVVVGWWRAPEMKDKQCTSRFHIVSCDMRTVWSRLSTRRTSTP